MSEQQSHGEPGSLHLQLLDVMRAKFDVHDGKLYSEMAAKWNISFHVIKWLLLQMSSRPARNMTTTTQVLQPSLISSTCSVLLIKTSLCIHGGVFVEAGRLNSPAN